MFESTPVYATDDGVVFGLRVPAVPGPGDRVVRVTEPYAGRPDLLSQAHQGTHDLWWLVADLNDLVDPLLEVTANRDLRVRPNRQ